MALLACVTTLLARSVPVPSPQYRTVDWTANQLGPKRSVRVYWVGHSLMEARAETDAGEISLLSLVGRFATSKGLTYSMGDHTLYGAPLSLQWRGRPHSYRRDVPERVLKRKAFEAQAASYDSIVLTETVPIGTALNFEHSAYYLQNFYCALKRGNPQARVFLYENWVNLQAPDPQAGYPPADRFDWRDRMIQDRALWDRLADTASGVRVPKPSWWSGVRSYFEVPAPACEANDPIFTVPVGTALVALHDRLIKSRPDDNFSLRNGEHLTLGHLFVNPYVDWPAEWPLEAANNETSDPKARISKLTLRDPASALDDIHPSQIGIYFVSLVHFATLYRQSPVGLPSLTDIGDPLARTLQCIAWEVVVRDPRTGVAGNSTC